MDKIAYTDSWVIEKSALNTEQKAFMQTNAIHYEASNMPLGQPLQPKRGIFTCPVVSAGHSKHEYTTGYAQKLIWQQFNYVPKEEQKRQEWKKYF